MSPTKELMMHLSSLFSIGKFAALGLVLLVGCSGAENPSDETNDELSSSDDEGCDDDTKNMHLKNGDELVGIQPQYVARDYITNLKFAPNGTCKANVSTETGSFSVQGKCTIGGSCGSRTLTVANAFTLAMTWQSSAVRFELDESRPVSTRKPMNMSPFTMKWKNKAQPAPAQANAPRGTECTDNFQCSPKNGSLSECSPAMPVCENGRCTCSD
jgi:hypothetical protein